jgi:NAD(P)-dependent dehydrogenase (short-subunit alcohol dehydrogenase family)
MANGMKGKVAIVTGGLGILADKYPCHPLRRERKGEEEGVLVFYLVSDASSFINGESVEMNGGTYFQLKRN